MEPLEKLSARGPNPAVVIQCVIGLIGLIALSILLIFGIGGFHPFADFPLANRILIVTFSAICSTQPILLLVATVRGPESVVVRRAPLIIRCMMVAAGIAMVANLATFALFS